MDHVPCLKAWADSLGGITFPLVSDFWPHGHVAQLYGVFREEGHSERAIFVIDAEGRITYIDIHAIDDQPDNEVLLGELAKAAGVELPPAEPQRDENLPEGVLLMYCTPYCPDCRRARQWLDAEGIEYIEMDVTADPSARARATAFNEGALHTPTFEIDGEVCVDFHPDRLDEILGRR